MKRMLSGFVVLALLVSSQSHTTAANKTSNGTKKYVVFHATGAFYSGDELAGTITIETTTGKVVSANLAVLDFFGNTVLAAFNGIPETLTGSASTEIFVGAANSTVIALVIPSASLKGYAGGDLVPGPYESRWWSWDGIDPLVGGTLEP